MCRLGCEALEDRPLLATSPAIQLFNASPALFVENLGQIADESVGYAFQGCGANVLFTDAGPVFQVFQRDPTEAADRTYYNGAEGFNSYEARCGVFKR